MENKDQFVFPSTPAYKLLKELILQTSQQGWTLATGTEKPLPVGTISGVQPCFVPNSQPESYGHSPGLYTLINYQQQLNSEAPVCTPTASLLTGLVLRQLQDKSQQLTDPTESLVVQEKSYFLSQLRPKKLNRVVQRKHWDTWTRMLQARRKVEAAALS